MRIDNNRLFPYPLLNHEKLNSQYKEKNFSLNFDEVTTENEFKLVGLSYETDSAFLKKLIVDGEAKAYCVVECSQTMFRRTYEISEIPQELSVPLRDLCGKTTISAFVIATRDIHNYNSEEFVDDYSEYSFDIEKDDIIAVDNGYLTTIDFDSEEDTKKNSIFLIIKDKNIKDELIKTDVDSCKITISLPESQWDIYDNTKKQSKLEYIYFSLIAIPALTYALGLLQKNGDDIDQLCIDYRWFSSFKNKFEELNNCELTEDVFEKMNAFVEAQKVMNMPNTKAIDDIFSLSMNSGFGGNDDD